MIQLTDEEILEAIDVANGGSEWRKGWSMEEVIEEQDRSIAKAQLKKVVENLIKIREHYLETAQGIANNDKQFTPEFQQAQKLAIAYIAVVEDMGDNDECWQALLKEVSDASGVN